MKKIIFQFIAIMAVVQLQAQTMSQNFNSGNRTLESNLCWYSPGCSFVNGASELIEGTFTLRTGQLTGGISNPNGLITPWSKLTGNDTLTFKHKLTIANGTTRTFYVFIESADNRRVLDTLFKYNYVIGSATTLRSEKVAIPANTAGKVYRLHLMAIGIGGNSRMLLDDVRYKGEYWSSPSTGCTPLATIADADSDGVADAEDSFANDATRAFATVYPASENGTLLFEDLWPSKGDYDFNDLVLNYRITTVTNASNQVVETKYTFITKAIGGALRNGFAFQLDDISAQKVIKVTRSKNAGSLYTLTANGTEANQTFANIPVISDASLLLPSAGGTGVNVSKLVSYVAPDTTTITVTFLENGQPALGQTAITTANINSNNFNPYLIVNQSRNKEIHGANKKPSNLAATNFFATQDDDSNAATNRFYKTKNNLPWALNVAADIIYTQEGVEISTGYLKLVNWAISGGANFTDWYMDKPGYRANNNLYIR